MKFSLSVQLFVSVRACDCCTSIKFTFKFSQCRKNGPHQGWSPGVQLYPFLFPKFLPLLHACVTHVDNSTLKKKFDSVLFGQDPSLIHTFCLNDLRI